MALRISLTSPMGLEVNGEVQRASQLGRPQVRLALAMLVQERRRPVPRHELAEVLWPEGLPEAWESALRGVMSKVRTLFVSAGLHADVLTSASGCYQLHLPADAVVDVEAADAALEEAMSALAREDWDRACDAGRVALEVLERPFLPAEGNERAARGRTHLRALELRALEAVCAGRLGRGDVTLAVDAAEAILALEPYRESAYRRLMAAHATAGSRGEALRAYDRCRSLLADELGVGPSAETEAQYVALLGNEPEPERVEAPAAGGGGRAAPAGVPSWPALPPLVVGRDREQGALSGAWRLAQCGQRQLVLLAGEAGIGKSALALDIAAGARAGAISLYGRCDRTAWTAYQPFVEAFGRYEATCSPDALRPGVGVSSFRSMLPALHAQRPHVDKIGSDGDRHGLFMAAASALCAMASGCPVILILDDVQWADGESLLLLRHLVRGLPSSRLLIVAAFRPEEVRGNPLLVEVLSDLEREPGVRRLDVPCLDRAAGEALARLMTGPRPAPAMVDRLFHASGGNPFLLTQLLTCPKSPGCGDGGETGVPPAITALVERRRSRLDRRVNRLVELCAVIGADIPLGVLHEASGMEMGPLLDALEDAASAGLVDDAHGAVARFHFRHPILCQAVYNGIAPSRRGLLHVQVGEALERRLSMTSPACLLELKRHFLAGAPVGSSAKALDVGGPSG